VEITKPGGRLVVEILGGAFVGSIDARIFNLVPGFEALALALPMSPEGVTVRITARGST
jgi:hypothetical protein